VRHCLLSPLVGSLRVLISCLPWPAVHTSHHMPLTPGFPQRWLLTLKLSPQPQLPVALGLLKTNSALRSSS
jgi:hypothetical protein